MIDTLFRREQTVSEASNDRTGRSWTAKLPLVMGLIALVCGVAGFQLESRDVSLRGLFAAVYATAQLFLLNVDVARIDNLLLRIAAVAAPLATAGAALTVFGARARQAYLRWQLKRHPPRDLLIGGGNASHQLIRAIPRRKDAAAAQRVVVLDKDPHCRLTQDSLLNVDAPFELFEGSGTSPDDLRDARALGASHVWIVCGSDETNLEVLGTMLRELRRLGDREPPAERHWYVEVDSTELLRHAVDFHQVPKGSRVELHFFSLDRLLARRALQYHPTDCAPQAHIAVVGGSGLAERLVLQAVQHLVFSEHPAESVRVSWFGQHIESPLAGLRERHPALDARLAEADPGLARLLPLAEISAYAVDELAISPAAWRAAQAGSPFTAVYIAVDGSERLAVAAQRAVALREYQGGGLAEPYPIIVCSTAVDASGESITRRLWGKDVTVAALERMDLSNVDIDGYPDSTNDVVAKKIHQSYQEGKADPRPWEETTEWERLSSRLSADHLRIKQAMLNVAPADVGAQDELLARLEHRRYVVERLISGWLPAPTHVSKHQPGNSGLKLDAAGKDFLRFNATLRPYDELDPGDKKYLLDSIRPLLKMG
jgi:hypothetical protein